MVENKNQHYVPSVYLRNFSNSESKKTISVWMFRDNKFVLKAPIKGQCSKSFLYGKDLILEKALQEPEGIYGNRTKKIILEEAASEEDLEGLLFFWLLQRNRGYVSITNMDAAFREIRDRAFDKSPESQNFLGDDLSLDGVAKLAFLQTKNQLAHITDLSICLVKNSSTINFLTNDNPATDANRFMQLRLGKRFRNWGLASSGLYLFLPISPKLGFLAFDRGVYSPSVNKDLSISVSSHDVHALNYLTLINSNNCMYFSDEGDRAYIESSLSHFADKVPRKRFKINLATNDEKKSEGKKSRRYTVSSDSNFQSSQDGIIHLELRQPIPEFHFPSLKAKAIKRFIDTKTGAGVIRPNSKAEFQFKYGRW